jgi:hypothetical protein
LTKTAIRTLPGFKKRRVQVVFEKRDASVSDDAVLERMRRAIDLGNTERLLRVEIVHREYDRIARAFIFDGEALVAPRLTL